MNDAKYLELLIYCYRCYKKKSEATRFYISECMHVLCGTCFKPSKNCVICLAPCNFTILDDQFSSKLLKNPSEAFSEPVESLMFQLSSALNLIMHQKGIIIKLKDYLKKAKTEIMKNKSCKGKESEKRLFNFQKMDKKEQIDRPDQKIEEIYNQVQIDRAKRRNEEKYVNNDSSIVELQHFRNPNMKERNYESIEIKGKRSKLGYFNKKNDIETGNRPNIKKQNVNRRNAYEFDDNKYRVPKYQTVVDKNEDTSNTKTNKRRFLYDITNKNNAKKYYTNYNPALLSVSSSKNSRFTVKTKDINNDYTHKKRKN